MVWAGKWLTNRMGFREHNRRYEAGLNSWEGSESSSNLLSHRRHLPQTAYGPRATKPRGLPDDNFDLPRFDCNNRPVNHEDFADWHARHPRPRGSNNNHRGNDDDLPDGPILPGPGFHRMSKHAQEKARRSPRFMDPRDPAGSPWAQNNPEVFAKGQAMGLGGARGDGEGGRGGYGGDGGGNHRGGGHGYHDGSRRIREEGSRMSSNSGRVKSGYGSEGGRSRGTRMSGGPKMHSGLY